MKLRKFLIALLFSAVTLGLMQAQTVVKMTTNKKEYAVGDLVTVKIELVNNPGLQGLYFDLNFDSSVMELEKFYRTSVLNLGTNADKFLYAVSEKMSADTLGTRIVTGYAVEDPDLTFTASGIIAYAQFRITQAGSKDQKYRFTFTNNGIIGMDGSPVSASFQNSNDFTLKTLNGQYFITIRSPYHYEVFNTDTALVSGIASAGAGNYIILKNENTGYISSKYPAANGAFIDLPVNLNYGYNRLIANLHNSGNTLLATQSVTVYRTEEENFIKITSPADHALVNTDIVEVHVLSFYPNVQVNDATTDALEAGPNGKTVYRSRIWLKSGFNEIKAQVRSPEGLVFKDSIAVYYQKNDTVFQFTKPLSGQVFKSGSLNLLETAGEIGSLYNNDHLRNTVTVNVIFYPDNPVLKSYSLLTDAPALILENSTDVSQSAYLFKLANPLSLDGMDSGTIEIIAYKNKAGTAWENEIHRFVRVDNSRLEINLVQPNIYGYDTLDSFKKLSDFNNNEPPSADEIEFNANGSFTLSSSVTVVNKEFLNTLHAARMIELKDGSVLALLNSNNTLKIYKKEFGKNEWNLYLSRDDMYGYDLCETDMGLLVGVTNLYGGTNTGLYLVNSAKQFVNIVTGQPLTYVQFIRNDNGTVYLYGNDYSNLYSFNIFSLQPDGARLKANITHAVPFNNRYFIRQFILSENGKTAVLRTSADTIHIYQKSGDAYEEIYLNPNIINPDDAYRNIVYCRYPDSEYNAFLLPQDEAGAAKVIMENKATGRLIYSNINLGSAGNLGFTDNGSLAACGVSGENFIFVYKNNLYSQKLYLAKGRIYFDTLVKSAPDRSYIYNGTDELTLTETNLLATQFGQYYLGFGTHAGSGALYHLFDTFTPKGTMTFYYKNDQIDGLKGFRFETDPRWLDASADFVKIGFHLTDRQGYPLNIGTGKVNLGTFIKTGSELFKIEHEYDTVINQEIVYINFSQIQKNCDLVFELELNAAGTISPEIGNFTVLKKNFIRVPRSGSDKIILPIRGFVTDPTVGEINISGYPVQLDRNNAFSYDLEILSNEPKVEVMLSCHNSLGTTANLDFTVEIFESRNNLWNIALKDETGQNLVLVNNQYKAENETLKISGYYYGLIGATAGYELYGYYYDENNEEKLSLLRKGVFDQYNNSETLTKAPSLPQDWPQPPDNPAELTGGYEFGRFENQLIRLSAGRQRLKIYVENPGGYRRYFMTGELQDQYPDVIYNVSNEDQKILITNIFNVSPINETYNFIKYNKEILTVINETAAAAGQYVYQKELVINGEIKSLYKFTELKVRSYQSAVKFENGDADIIIPVDVLNRFNVTLKITMPENCETENYYIAFIPTAPFMEFMNIGVKVKAVKSFRDAYIVPDFDLMKPNDSLHPFNWTDTEIRNLEKEVRLKFTRYIPDNTTIKLIVNFLYTNADATDDPAGTLEEMPGTGVYRIKKADNTYVKLTILNGLKYGTNRIQWLITHKGETVSSSTVGRLGMSDFVFDLAKSGQSIKTVIDFPVDLNAYYTDSAQGAHPLPDLTITKDQSTYIKVVLNNQTIYEDRRTENPPAIRLAGLPAIKEGRNQLSVYYQEVDGYSRELAYSFLYDTVPPTVEIASLLYDQGYLKLAELTAKVKEKNLQSVTLLYGTSVIDLTTDIQYIGDDVYEITWRHIDSYPYIDVIPGKVNTDKAITVSVADHAGYSAVSTPFEGLGDQARPEQASPIMVDISGNYYQVPGTPRFDYNEANYQNRPFKDHAKYYRSDIELENKILQSPLLVQRNLAVSAGNNFIVDAQGKLTIEAKNKIRLLPGFTVNKGGYLRAAPVSFQEINTIRFHHDQASSTMSFAFWFRYEQENFYAFRPNTTLYPGTVDETHIEIRRIITLYTDRDDPDHSIYLASGDYNGINNDGNEYIYLVEQDDDDMIIWAGYDSTNRKSLIPFSNSGRDDWNLVCLGIDSVTHSFTISVNKNQPVSISNSGFEELISAILAADAPYYFDCLDTQNQREFNNKQYSGHFSIAEPFYINQLVTINDIVEFKNKLPESSSSYLNQYATYNYTFDSTADRVGDAFYDLRTLGRFYTDQENYDYTGLNKAGSLKASKIHSNLLSVNDTGTVVFNDLKPPILYNLNNPVINPNDNTMTLIPQNPNYTGRYYFSNYFGSHGLQPDDYYSVSGYIMPPVDPVNEPVDAAIVLSVNGNTQSLQLKAGYFHFIYKHNRTTPQSVILYLETNNALTFKRDLIFNEGNYILPLTEETRNGLDKSRASTQFTFGSSGTVSFWYKPFTVNREGLSNYEAVIFDSEFVKIRTVLNAQKYACYQVEIKAEDGITVHTVIPTTTPVKMGWQHIHFTYLLNGNDKDIAYLYINGKMAGIKEDITFPLSVTMKGNTLEHDNIFIGSDQAANFFAEGFIDNVWLSNFYKRSTYQSFDPVEFAYTDYPESQLTLKIKDQYMVNDIRLTLESRETDYTFSKNLTDEALIHENGYYLINHALPVNILETGRYRLNLQMKINGKNYSNNYAFIRNYRPHFIIKHKTPFVIFNELNNISFELEYDDAYLKKEQSALYAGVVIRTKYYDLSSNSEKVKTRYITENFRNPGQNDWITGDASQDIYLWDNQPVNYNLFNYHLDNIKTSKPIEWEIRSFYLKINDNSTDINQYFFEHFHFDSIDPEYCGMINDARLAVETGKNSQNGQEYKLDISIQSATGTEDILNHLSVKYAFNNTSGQGSPITGQIDLKGRKTVSLYFDDVLRSGADALYGVYDCTVTLVYDAKEYGRVQTTVTWKKVYDKITIQDEKRLEIVEFSLLSLNKEGNKADFYLEYSQNRIDKLYYHLMVTPAAGMQINRIYERTEQVYNPAGGYLMIRNVDVFDGVSNVRIEIYDNPETGLTRSKQIAVNNSVSAPEVVIINTVPALIAYNNVVFTWKGYHEKKYKNEIQYSYNFDNKGWCAPGTELKKLEIYNLKEGYHNFSVKAIYLGQESPVSSVTFFVDINKPKFIAAKIKITEKYGDDQVKQAVTIYGETGAVEDASLTGIYLNGTKIQSNAAGEFAADNIELTIDGTNTYTLTAYDKVGNYTDYTVTVQSPVTQLIFPDLTTGIKYAPLTIVGKIKDNINTGMQLYLYDITTEIKEAGNFTSWKKAKINQDKTFFIEDVFVNPGTATREAETTLYLVSVLTSGKKFYKEIKVKANEMIRPIDLTLSTHAAEGENADTVVSIGCKANIDNISSWSVDFNGDGIYDLVDTVNNPLNAKTHAWTHGYSSLGLVKPRVRVITRDGNYFSVSDSLIIHEKIKEASNNIILDPIAMTAVSVDGDAQKIFVLAGKEDHYAVDVYKIERDDNYISNRLFSISLSDYGITHPVRIAAADENTLYVACNNDDEALVYKIRANEQGNYEPVYEETVSFDQDIYDLAVDENGLYVSFINNREIYFIPVVNQLVKKEDKQLIDLGDANLNLTGKFSITRDIKGLLIADYYQQRVIRLSENNQLDEYFGSFGNGEKEFLQPSLLRAYENRIFVYDASRYDVQVFDANFNTVTTLNYQLKDGYGNYVEPQFFDDLADMAMVTRMEGNRLYYYALLLSRSSGKLSMLKLPQWEELRARVRNNKIVVLNNNEVLLAKPDGNDLARLISTDAIPRIEGTLNYPALSPDGRKLVFASRKLLYNGTQINTDNEDIYSYDNLYMINVDGTDLVRIPLGIINDYEIERPVFNYNGNRIILSAKSRQSINNNWQIYEYDIDSGVIGKLFSSDENARFPYYSPDDRFIVFTTDYDGDEEIEILDTQNTSIRVSVTHNNCRDSLPVWSAVYPYEIANPDYKIESKIAYVSERNSHKAVYYTYLSRASESDIRVVTKDGQQTGDNPDSAALGIVSDNRIESSYPCFTGDGKAVVYEQFDGSSQSLQRYDFTAKTSSAIPLPEGSLKPAGMKNCIANFNITLMNGNDVKLTWTPYTDQNIFYTVRFKKNTANEAYIQKKVFTKDQTLIQGLEMGVEYIFNVSIIENGVEETSTLWKKVLIPEVVARPTVTVDTANPYLVKLHAWKPLPETDWSFIWLIDNQEINAQTSQDYLFEYATSGTKTIVLKAKNKAGTYTSVSEPVTVELVSDIHPVIESVLANDSSYIQLDASRSTGKKIDWANALWTISGPGQQTSITAKGQKNVIVDLTGFRYKIKVTLQVPRIAVIGQNVTDIIQSERVIVLDYTEVKPIITYESDKVNKRLFYFSGDGSLGNIDWYRAKWVVYGDGIELKREEGVSSFAYQFAQSNNAVNYSVALTVPRRNDGTTKTASVIVNVESCPIEPVIDYEVLTIQEGDNITGAKIILTCTGSKGDSIDFNNARWTVPVAGNYSEQPTQIGPTAVYNLIGAASIAVVDVSLTLGRRGGTDVKTVTKIIYIKSKNAAKTELVVTTDVQSTTNGKTIVFDALKSTGPNIEWEKTEWLFDGVYAQKGPTARYEVPQSGEKKSVVYTCTLYQSGQTPVKKTGTVEIEASGIVPFITTALIGEAGSRVYDLSVLETKGINIDWEKTLWHIYDGNESVVVKQGPKINHAFAPKENRMGYPVMVEMFYKGYSLPFVGYTTIDVEGNVLVPVIQWDLDREDKNTVRFSAESSQGANIEWQSVKWTFGDGTESQYGATATHKYIIDDKSHSYRVSLTLTRRDSKGVQETKTAYTDIDIKSDEIVPVIKARLYNNGYLVLSAEESKGRGLMLDRSSWLFEGEGDSQSLNVNQKVGTVSHSAYSTNISNSSNKSSAKSSTENYSWSIGNSLSFSSGVGDSSTKVFFNNTSSVNFAHSGGFNNTTSTSDSTSSTTGSSESYDTTSYEGFIDNTESFSSSNSHIGAVCRRYVGTYDIATAERGEKSRITVTLFVYRTSATGETDGKSITVVIDLVRASEDEVLYK